ncbi:MAG: ABC transporter ATP-binding protein [Eubacteriales bacterium]|nr:ABC transporter ATP-binding protein [Eubacteriales bacterium]
MDESKILQVTSAIKKFGGLVAVNDVSLHLNKGEILGLIGPNGAGKTTLFNGIAGADRFTSGKVEFMGTDITNMSAHKRCRLGISRTFQITKPFASLTVLQNVSVGALFGSNKKINQLKTAEIDRSEAEAEKILEFLGLSSKKDLPAEKLNVSERKRLELCRALATKPKLLLTDEVVAGLNPSEVGGMMESLQEINRTGISILMIEHVMKAVMGISHRIVVLNFGEMIAEGSPDEVRNNPDVILAYLGRRK